MNPLPTTTGRCRWRQRLLVAAAVLLMLAGGVYVAMLSSPRPAVWLIRQAFDLGAAQASRALDKHQPPGVQTHADIPYSPLWPQLGLDVHRPSAQGGDPLPVLVWAHGGAFVSGRKEDVANYLRVVAAHGFVVVGLDYGLAPEAVHPLQARQVHEALRFVSEQAAAWGGDGQRLVLAGDSAGAQLAAQVAAAVTDPGYARALGLDEPLLERRRLRGVALFCGPFDFSQFHFDGLVGSLLHAVWWAFTGSRETTTNPALALASVPRHLTPGFPPAFVTAGNGDPLLPHSTALVERLRALGVTVDPLFFEPGLQPPLGHEHQFNLDRPEGRTVLERLVAFLRARTR